MLWTKIEMLRQSDSHWQINFGRRGKIVLEEVLRKAVRGALTREWNRECPAKQANWGTERGASCFFFCSSSVSLFRLPPIFSSTALTQRVGEVLQCCWWAHQVFYKIHRNNSTQQQQLKGNNSLWAINESESNSILHKSIISQQFLNFLKLIY